MNISSDFELSLQQKHTLRLQGAGRTQDRCRMGIRIQGELNKQVLKDKLSAVLNAHDVFKIRLQPSSALVTEYQQETVGDVDVIWSDRSDYAEDPQTSDVLWADSRLGIHASIIEVEKNIHNLILDVPTLVADSSTLVNIFLQLVGCFREEAPTDIIQYGDYVDWQNKLAEDPAGTEYWRQRDSQDLDESALPFRAGSKIEALAIKSVVREISLPEIPNGFSEARLLACWLALLFKVCGGANIPVGSLTRGRVGQSLRFAMGPFDVYTPVICEINNTDSIGDIEERISMHLRNAHLYHLDHLLLDPSTKGSNIQFEYHAWPEAQSTAGLVFQLDALEAHADRHCLKLRCVKTKSRGHIRLYYDDGMFKEKDVAYLLQLFENIIKSSSADVSVEQLSWMTEQDVLRLFSFNATNKPIAAKNFISFFEQMVDAQPNAIAVEHKGIQFTYSELNARANRIAHRLLESGVQQGAYCGIFLPQSIDLVSSIIAVLKTGAAYIAVDFEYPDERVVRVLDKAIAVVSLSSKETFLTADLPSKARLLVDKESTAHLDASNLDVVIDGCQPAYVLYTSGSTGKPKGVVITHDNLINYLSYALHTYFFSLSNAIVHTSIGFDLTVTSLFTPLLKGGKVLLVDHDPELANLKASLVSQREPVLIKATPSHLKILNSWLETLNRNAINLGVMVLGGEALSSSDLRIWFEKLSAVTVFNEYGPTEATVGCCVYEVNRADVGMLPIGTPIWNTSLYVLDPLGRPVPEWVTGELYIGGKGIAQGYINDSASTSKVFISDPFRGREGAIMYKTGDLVRLISRDSLMLDYVGRNDSQVKVRGHRIELGEIEAYFKAEPEIADAVVLASVGKHGGVSLKAFYVAKSSISKQVLLSRLALKAPEYMIPAELYEFDSFPLNANGKVERGKLEGLAAKNSHSQAYVEPGTSVEKELAGIWAQVLKHDLISLNDNFFEKGGDSIRAVHVVAKARASGLSLSVQELFKYPVLKDLALNVERLMADLRDQESKDYERLLKDVAALSDDEALEMLQEMDGENGR